MFVAVERTNSEMREFIALSKLKGLFFHAPPRLRHNHFELLY
jgi:hypothetical protein